MVNLTFFLLLGIGSTFKFCEFNKALCCTESSPSSVLNYCQETNNLRFDRKPQVIAMYVLQLNIFRVASTIDIVGLFWLFGFLFIFQGPNFKCFGLINRRISIQSSCIVLNYSLLNMVSILKTPLHPCIYLSEWSISNQVEICEHFYERQIS